ncbi:Kunitz/Bovine pancreatic trypsin inhibitor domain protein [Teladorsagia circumcincta]|uniref:Kunitz/Bovine pancreatic trypsin inhibitor domain protein n=1 Tax=Teladorsagia circumcincta TaxID=45464 RepID=A0A2G9TH10_TELCI|nr:Kunitz/Bovine pancreatic trypsin inhibitor domain protein [Teladorsagia circumcincta]
MALPMVTAAFVEGPASGWWTWRTPMAMGNQNNFESLEECESTCRDANPCEEGIPVPSIGESPRWQIIIN